MTVGINIGGLLGAGSVMCNRRVAHSRHVVQLEGCTMLARCTWNVKSSWTPTGTRPGTCSPIPRSSRRGSALRSRLDLRPGGAAAYIEPDGTMRHAVIEHVREGERLSFVWWDADEGATSRVVFELTPVEHGTKVAVTETRASVAGGSFASSARRDVGRPPLRSRAPLRHTASSPWCELVRRSGLRRARRPDPARRACARRPARPA